MLNTTFIYDGNVVYYKVNPEGIALEIHDLNKDVPAKGGKKTILDKVSLSIEPNEFVAIIGGSGAGKTTLMTAMSGFDSKVTGQVCTIAIHHHLCDHPFRGLRREDGAPARHSPQASLSAHA